MSKNIEISKLIFDLSSPEDRSNFTDSRIRDFSKKFNKLSADVDESIRQMNIEYSQAFELLMNESDKKVKLYLIDLKKNMDKKVIEINSLLDNLKDKTEDSENSLKEQIQEAQKEIKSIINDSLIAYKQSKNDILETISELVDESKISFSKTEDKVEKLNKEIDELKKDFISKISSISEGRGGSMNRRISVNGAVISNKYTDINFKGSGLTYSAVDNDITRQVDFTLLASISSTYQRPTSGVVNGINTVFTFLTAPNVLAIDETKTIQKLQSDGITANWTGTTTITLTQSIPQFDLFAIA